MVISAYFSLIRGLYKFQIRCASPTRFRLLCPLFEEIGGREGTISWTGLRSESPLFEKIVERIQFGSSCGGSRKDSIRGGGRPIPFFSWLLWSPHWITKRMGG